MNYYNVLLNKCAENNSKTTSSTLELHINYSRECGLMQSCIKKGICTLYS